MLVLTFALLISADRYLRSLREWFSHDNYHENETHVSFSMSFFLFSFLSLLLFLLSLFSALRAAPRVSLLHVCSLLPCAFSQRVNVFFFVRLFLPLSSFLVCFRVFPLILVYHFRYSLFAARGDARERHCLSLFITAGSP